MAALNLIFYFFGVAKIFGTNPDAGDLKLDFSGILI